MHVDSDDWQRNRENVQLLAAFIGAEAFDVDMTVQNLPKNYVLGPLD